MAQSIHEEPDKSRSEVRVAGIIVGDTIRSAYTDPKLLKGATVEDTLDLLKGESGDLVTQGVISQYLLSPMAEIASGVTAGLDLRAAQQPVNINAQALKQEMINQLEAFLHLDQQGQVAFLQNLMDQG